ncbi:MAG: ArsC family reductase [Gammaproteobacteria bacterium]|nr:ArsC family reductase [Gammaproteobacteria bacterium]MDH5776870.1 ArsC family reductase [Gammaproteobacteria bacterium]
MTTVYGIKNCDTVKKALKWLDKNKVTYQFHDLRKDGITKNDLQGWLKNVDWEVLLNKRSTTWRQLADTDKTSLDANKAITLMLANPTLIKRPVITKGKTTLVGFNDSDYKKALN